MELTFQNIADHKLPTAFGLITQLRGLLSIEDFTDIYKEVKKANQYALLGAYHQEDLVGLIGYRILPDDVNNKQLYIDDLVVDSAFRQKGIGSKMLKHAENLVNKLDCNGIRLSTGVTHEQGIKFYQKEGWALKAYSFKKGF